MKIRQNALLVSPVAEVVRLVGAVVGNSWRVRGIVVVDQMCRIFPIGRDAEMCSVAVRLVEVEIEAWCVAVDLKMGEATCCRAGVVAVRCNGLQTDRSEVVALVL